MLKFLIILVLISYVLFRIIGFIFKSVFVASSQFQQKQNVNGHTSNSKRRAPDSNLNIEYIPKDGNKKGKGARGGDYVDYEEV